MLLGIRAEVDKAMSNGSTRLCISPQNGHEKVCKMLLGSGADIDKAMDSGSTPFVYLCRERVRGDL